MKIQVNLSDEMVERVDMYAKKMGVSRSALCSTIIGQAMMTYDKTFESFEKVGLDVLESLASDRVGKNPYV